MDFFIAGSEIVLMLADWATYKDGKLELFTINVKYCISFDKKGGILGIKIKLS